MKTSIPRIGSVKLKNGGAKLSIIRNTVSEDCTKAFANNCDHIRAVRGANMAGFAIVAWSVDGGLSTSIRVSDSRQVGRGMVPDFVRSQLIEHLATD
jgi:hypothetical protein